jgi:hypothetical protein
MYFVILVLIITSILPSLVVKAQNSENNVNYVINSWDDYRVSSQTIRFTKQQSEHLQHFIDDFISKLNNASTNAEVKAIYYDALQRFREYGLISGEICQKILQRLLTNRFYLEKNSPMMKISPSNTDAIFENHFCVLAIKAYYIGVVGHLQMAFLRNYKYDEPYFNRYWLYWQIFDDYRHFFIGAQIRFGRSFGWGNNAWLSTLGILGYFDVVGEMHGLIPITYPNGNTDQVGVTGFTGIRLIPGGYGNPCFAFGIANTVRIKVT